MSRAFHHKYPRRPWAADEDAEVLTSSEELAVVAERLQRTYVAVKSRRRQLSGKVPLFTGKAKYLPRYASASRLLAKTCRGCGELCQADSFRLQATGTSHASTCNRCVKQELRASEVSTQNESLPKARNHFKEWTGAELEIAARTDLTSRQVADMLGRTLYAVKTARGKLKRDIE